MTVSAERVRTTADTQPATTTTHRPPEPAQSAWQRARPQRVDNFLNFTGGPRVRVQTGLDGVRGMAVIPVVLIHLEYFNLFSAPQLAMSLFFTQSGFLITTLVLNEFLTTSRFDLRSFWAQRARRLMPPAWITIAACGVVRLTTDVFSPSHREELIYAFVNVTNWQVALTPAFGETSFGMRSGELIHTWSLSIEEQFYVAVALLLFALITWVARPIEMLRWLAILGAAVSFSLPWVFDFERYRTFFGTDTRAGELLIGVAMATFMISRPLRVGLLRFSWLIATLGVVALGSAWAIWHLVGPLTAQALLPVCTIVWVFVILGAMNPDGPVAWMMHWRLLQWLGKNSYGIYIYHVPLLRAAHYLFPENTLLFNVVFVAVILLLAELSYRFVEIRIRRREIAGRPLAVGAAVLIGVIAVTTALT